MTRLTDAAWEPRDAARARERTARSRGRDTWCRDRRRCAGKKGASDASRSRGRGHDTRQAMLPSPQLARALDVPRHASSGRRVREGRQLRAERCWD